jgi:lipoprotein-anchoring transpeptidase ErfK/SrfK
MNTSPKPPSGSLRIFPSLLLILLCTGGLAALALTTSPASASIINKLGLAPTATHENLWAHAEIAKPTYTPTSLILPTETPTSVPTFIPTDTPTSVPPDTETPLPTITETPGDLAMDILENTPIPAHVEQQPSSGPLPSYGGTKYILVDISEQHLYAYDGDTLVYSFVSSTGMNNATRTGVFHVQSKIPNAYGATWNIWMPDWLGIYWAGGLENGIHALPILPNGATLWAGYLGRPISYGCVVLGSYEAQLLYDWAEMGTTVEIQR